MRIVRQRCKKRASYTTVAYSAMETSVGKGPSGIIVSCTAGVLPKSEDEPRVNEHYRVELTEDEFLTLYEHYQHAKQTLG